MLTSPLVGALKSRYPEAQIDFLTRAEYGDLVRYNPHIHRVYLYDVTGGFRGLRAVKAIVRGNQYDAILDMHRNFRSFYVRSFPVSAPVLKVKKDQLLRFLLVHFKLNLYKRIYSNPPSVAEKYLRAAAPLGISATNAVPELYIPDEVNRKMERAWEELRQENVHLAIAPGARHFTKRWPADYYVDLIRRVHRQWGWKTVLLGGRDEEFISSRILARAGSEAVTDYTGKLSILETAALIFRVPFFVSNDSGLMHIAASFRKQQIAIFGSTTRELGFFPLNSHAVVLENQGLKCRPCSHIGRASCPAGHFKCMLDISPQQVFLALQSLRQNI